MQFNQNTTNTLWIQNKLPLLLLLFAVVFILRRKSKWDRKRFFLSKVNIIASLIFHFMCLTLYNKQRVLWMKQAENMKIVVDMSNYRHSSATMVVDKLWFVSLIQNSLFHGWRWYKEAVESHKSFIPKRLQRPKKRKLFILYRIYDCHNLFTSCFIYLELSKVKQLNDCLRNWNKCK